MSSSVGHNSLVMAIGTAASRLTGQIRTILLAAAVGTTGMAANAYQAGSMIPQVIFSLISGGIFNAVLVPQIVRTLKEDDAEDRLNKLITFAIALLAGITVAMMLLTATTPAFTHLYANGGKDMLALTNAFALWCMPQIFFYGLYTVLGQILAAKNHFGMYAWSSVAANIVSCAGFTLFIVLFGKADKQPLNFWTTDKIMLTAGTWTLGVAVQALVLFIPLFRLGVHYRWRWGVHGIGLRSMGSVAAWSLGIVGVDQLLTILSTRITTNAPLRAHQLFGIDETLVAGNATYQNAFTIYILPYSLIAVSVATAVFPKISRAVADNDMQTARIDLSDALRNVSLLMSYFTAVFVVMSVPISLALLPSISVGEAQLMSGPMIALSLSLPLSRSLTVHLHGCPTQHPDDHPTGGHVYDVPTALDHDARGCGDRRLCDVIPAAGVDAAQAVREPSGWEAYRLVVHQGERRHRGGDRGWLVAAYTGLSSGWCRFGRRSPSHELDPSGAGMRDSGSHHHRHVRGCALGHAHRGVARLVVVAEASIQPSRRSTRRNSGSRERIEGTSRPVCGTPGCPGI